MVRIGIREKILGMTALTLGGTLVAVAWYDVNASERIVQEARLAEDELTEAIQVSVQQLGPTAEPDEALIRDYTKRLGTAGPRQIEILDSEKKLLVGTHRSAHTYLIQEEPESKNAPSTWDILVPVVAGKDKLGYVQLKMTSANFEDLLLENRERRMAVNAIAFALAVILAALIASQITGPLKSLRLAAQRVARGDLDVELPKNARDEVGQLVQSFAEMIGGLRERERLKSRLDSAERDAMLGRVAAGIAHDVRNPLNYLSLAIDHLVATSSSPEAAPIAAQMKSELARADSRIAEFLRLGKPVEVHPEQVPVKAILESVVLPASTPDRPVTVEAEGLGEAWWDAGVVEAILRNLVTNAQQASEGKGPVEVRAAELEPGVIHVQVDDPGPGIAPEDRERIFEPWFTTKADGVGLGLAIARRAAREHGGDVVAVNRPEGGARFTLKLPRDARRAAGASAAGATAATVL